MAITIQSNISQFETVSQSNDGAFLTRMTLDETCELLGHSVDDLEIRETNASLRVGRYTVVLGGSLRGSDWEATREFVNDNWNDVEVAEMEDNKKKGSFLLMAYLRNTSEAPRTHKLRRTAKEEESSNAESHKVSKEAQGS